MRGHGEREGVGGEWPDDRFVDKKKMDQIRHFLEQTIQSLFILCLIAGMKFRVVGIQCSVKYGCCFYFENTHD